MIIKVLASRLIDILLILAAIYFLVPGVRRYFRKQKLESEPKQPRYTVFTNNKHRATKHHGQGEYIDYEEVK